MKIIAFEEHYKSRAIEEANKGSPTQRTYDEWKKENRFQPKDPAMGVPPGIFDLGDQRIAAMDEAGIDVQILSHTTPGPEELDPKISVELAQQANETVHGAVTRYPDRLKGFATLPMRDPNAAAQELERTVNQLGFVGALINGHVAGRYLDDKYFWPVFEAAESLDVPIYLHPNRPPQAVVDTYYSGFAPIVSGWLAQAGVGWHFDTGVHCLRLILRGVFDKFPRLQIIAGHHFELLSWIAWRAQYSFPPNETGLKKWTLDYILQNFYGGLLAGDYQDQKSGEIDPSWSLSFNAFRSMVDLLGVDRVLFTADYPYGNMIAARQFFDKMPLSPVDKEKIGHLNAERLLKLYERDVKCVGRGQAPSADTSTGRDRAEQRRKSVHRRTSEKGRKRTLHL